MKWLDYALVGGLTLVGLVHCFVVAPSAYDTLSANAFWFFGTGLAILFTAALNGLRIVCRGRAAGARWTALGATLAMLALVGAFGATQNALGRPDVYVQLGLYAGCAAMALLRRP